MFTGVIDKNSFPKVLQSVASARKSGDLDISVQERVFSLSFWRGKIVDFSEDIETSHGDIVKRLKDAEIVTGDIPEISAFKELTAFCDERGVSRELLKLVVGERLNDKLVAFSIEGTVPWGFRVAGVDVDLEISPGISVSQLLLDKAELESISGRFDTEFDSTSKFEKTGDEATTPAEKRIIEVLVNPLSVEELKRRSLLSELNLKVALLALLDKGVIKRVSHSLTSEELKTTAVHPAATDQQEQPGSKHKVSHEIDEIIPAEVTAVSLIFLIGSIAVAVVSWGLF